MSMIQNLVIKNEFTTFLKSCTVEKKGIHTNTSIAGGSYYIPKNKYEEFIKHYVDHVFIRNKPCHLTEKHSTTLM